MKGGPPGGPGIIPGPIGCISMPGGPGSGSSPGGAPGSSRGSMAWGMKGGPPGIPWIGPSGGWAGPEEADLSADGRNESFCSWRASSVRKGERLLERVGDLMGLRDGERRRRRGGLCRSKDLERR